MKKVLGLSVFLVIFILNEISLTSSSQPDVDQYEDVDNYLEASQIENFQEDSSTPFSIFQAEERASRRCRRRCRKGRVCVNSQCVPASNGGNGNPRPRTTPAPVPAPGSNPGSAPDPDPASETPTCLSQGAKCNPGNDQCCRELGCDSFPLGLAYCLPSTADGSS